MNLTGSTRIALSSLADFTSGLFSPTIRLGVTGLSRSGKTVFITALVHTLVHGGSLPLFNAAARGRISRVYLEPQPDDDLPRFAYESHLKALTGPDRKWPQSTRRLSQLRLTIEYAPQGFYARNIHGGKLHVDIIDYPGEWLLDLPLLEMGYEDWSAAALKAARQPLRNKTAASWLALTETLQAADTAAEPVARQAARLFTAYLAECSDDPAIPSTQPPGRFLIPGDLEGSPMLTFAPLQFEPGATAPAGSLHAMMKRRYNSYVSRVVRPFYVEHFARLDRQIVLVDVLGALNAGPDAIIDLSSALTSILASFRQGENSILSSLFAKRIDKVLFAATKADLLHHSGHDRLQDILGLIIAKAAKKASVAGTGLDVTALAAIRATREAAVNSNGEELACIAGIPEKGETIAKQTFNGKDEAAIFPGDLPRDPADAVDGSLAGQLHFVNFRPPELAPAKPLLPAPVFPHIRLDRALEFLLGDQFT